MTPPAAPNAEPEYLQMARLAAQEAGVPLALVLACGQAESGWNSRAERWGWRTEAAKLMIDVGDDAELQAIIDDVWPDISFGIGQRIVLYHYLGDFQPTLANCLAVREGVFADPQRDVVHMADTLAGCLAVARQSDLTPVGGDELLGALVVYNAGHMPRPDSVWWHDWAGNVANYRAAMAWAADVCKQP